jgi:hypothetical protein
MGLGDVIRDLQIVRGDSFYFILVESWENRRGEFLGGWSLKFSRSRGGGCVRCLNSAVWPGSSLRTTFLNRMRQTGTVWEEMKGAWEREKYCQVVPCTFLGQPAESTNVSEAPSPTRLEFILVLVDEFQISSAATPSRRHLRRLLTNRPRPVTTHG